MDKIFWNLYRFAIVLSINEKSVKNEKFENNIIMNIAYIKGCKLTYKVVNQEKKAFKWSWNIFIKMHYYII